MDGKKWERKFYTQKQAVVRMSLERKAFDGHGGYRLTPCDSP